MRVVFIKTSNMTDLAKIKDDINKQLVDKGTLESLIATTFKGFTAPMVKRAILEGVMRGFVFEDFLQKNVYAIPYGSNYNLVNSIDYARKIGMRSGIVGKSAPQYEYNKDGNIVSCEITVERKVGDHIGKYTAKVFFSEYTTGKNLWTTKPHTMIAKVAEMHALRMACPEELSQMYVEEEYQKPQVVIDTTEYESTLRNATTVIELKDAFLRLPGTIKKELMPVYEELKIGMQSELQELEGHVELTNKEKEQIKKEEII